MAVKKVEAREVTNMDEIWFEEDLTPHELAAKEIVKSTQAGSQLGGERAYHELTRDAESIIRVHVPRWGVLDPAKSKVLPSDTKSIFHLIRLGFEFEVRAKRHFVKAQCWAHIEPANIDEPQPTVYEVNPRDLYDGEPRRVNVKIGPTIEVLGIKGALGEVSTDFSLGAVEPVVVGYLGANEQEPHWQLRPHSKSLVGVRHLWLIVEIPHGCSGVLLAARIDGEVQTHWGPIPVSPKTHLWAERPKILIQ